MKKLIACFLVILIFAMSSCAYNKTFELLHEEDEISSIYIVKLSFYHGDYLSYTEVVKISEVEEFMNEFRSIECGTFEIFSDPTGIPSEYNNCYAIKIEFDNNDFNLIHWNGQSRYRESSGFNFYASKNTFDEKQFGELIEKYLTDEITEEPTLEESELIDYGEYYSVYKNTDFSFTYNIYSEKRKTILSETKESQVTVKMINPSIVDIATELDVEKISHIHRYCDVLKGVTSEEFKYVLANSNEFISYIHGDVMGNRKIIIQNIFDKDKFFKEYELNFSKLENPVINASFSDDETQLIITYLSGDSQSEITEMLPLYKTQ